MKTGLHQLSSKISHSNASCQFSVQEGNGYSKMPIRSEHFSYGMGGYQFESPQ